MGETAEVAISADASVDATAAAVAAAASMGLLTAAPLA